MTATATRLTYDDLDAIREKIDGGLTELHYGELIVTPAPIPDHQLVIMNILAVLLPLVRSRRLGRVYSAPVDVRFLPDLVYEPDIMFVSAVRLAVIGAKVIEAAPDLVMEILSPGTRARDLGEKRDVYARFGVREYWTVDLDARSVRIEVLRGDRFVELPIVDGIARSEVVPGFAIPVADVFADV